MLLAATVWGCQGKDSAAPTNAAVERAAGRAAEPEAEPEPTDAAAASPARDRAQPGEAVDESDADDDFRQGQTEEKRESMRKESPKPSPTTPTSRPADKKPAKKQDPLLDVPSGALERSQDPLVAELGRLEAKMRAAGLRPPADPAFANNEQAEQAKANLAKTSCEDLCELREAICGLENKICSLATEHDRPEYANACARAQGDCRVATEACSACSD